MLDVGNTHYVKSHSNQDWLIIICSHLYKDCCFLFQMEVSKVARQERNELVLAIGRRLFKGLRSLHGIGIVHCDVKPPNVLLKRTTEEVVICDYGATKRIGAR